MSDAPDITGYRYDSADLNSSHQYLLPALRAELARVNPNVRRVFDLGCGNGSIAAAMSSDGWQVTGVDVSAEGIENANLAFPQLKLETGSVYDDLAAAYGTYPVVVSLEVVEHLYDPRKYAHTLYNLVAPGGTAIISTPYHGYWKDLALAVSGKMDRHFHALWDHGHIKFWSMATLTRLLVDEGFNPPRFERVGRVPALAKSMIAIVEKT